MLATLFMLQTRYRTALVMGVLLPAYLLVVCGLFSWLPVLWFGQTHHQFEAADKGATVEWVIHHGHEQSSPIADSHADDHTMTLLTGPATISTMVIYAEKTRTFWEHAVLVGYGVVIGAAAYLAFAASGRIARVLGQTGINVMTRLMGLILAAMAVELLADGLVKLFPVLASHLAR